MKTINNLLLAAIEKDQVKLAYLWLKLGANVNQKISYTYEVYEDYGLSCVEAYYKTRHGFKSPLDFADSEAMKKLLKHFGGLPAEEAQKIWQEDDKRKKELIAQIIEKKEKRLAKKHERDNLFVNKLIK